MGESSACLLRSFSQPSPTSQESAEGDPIRRALTSSVSFGRFVSESLAWEKWSSFSQNRYLEEAEKYSKPGSVAEKKAYFEAHYKKIAAKKAAALLEQQNAVVDNIPVVNMTNGNEDNSPIYMEPAQECEHVKTEEMPGENTLNSDFVFCDDANQQSLPKETTMESTQTEGVEQAIEHSMVSENQVELSNQLQDAVNIHDNQEGASTLGDSASSEKKETASSSAKSSKQVHEPKIRSSVKPKVPIYPKQDHATSPFNKTASQSMEKKISTPKSLHMSIDFTSNKTSSPVSQKLVDSRLFKPVTRTSKERSNQQTLIKASMDGISKHVSVVPQPEKRRTKTLLDHSISQSASKDRTSKTPIMQHTSKSKVTCRSRVQSPIVSSSFSLRSEERASKRKEFFQKLEQKLNTKDTENEQHQSKQKVLCTEGKAKDESKDVRQSVSSKAEANADIPFGKKSASIAVKKISMLSCSPKIERKQSSEMQDYNSRPPWKLSTKTDNFRDVMGKNLRPPLHSAKLVPKKNMHENTSPNIQL
ncbi:hypothetical protein ACH5RR_030793 [Cinchona calisaya]|uniref:TPX2 C-terminal domain-containing protein n=1 Tax=Cinchona calisaya TaxID=153742 RepID=A0ABD2YVQ4_9GENT